MISFSKGNRKVEVRLAWDPSPLGSPDSDLDLIAATYLATGPGGPPSYLVHFGSRSPDGTITLDRDSTTGQGFGDDEVITLELDRLGAQFGRVVVGVAIQQHAGRMVFGDVAGATFRVVEGYTTLAQGNFAEVAGSTAATVAEFTRDPAGVWDFHPLVHGFDTDLDSFARRMGELPS